MSTFDSTTTAPASTAQAASPAHAASTARPTIGLAGIGKMGTSIARILEAAGYPLRVWSRSNSEMRQLATSVLVPTAKFVDWDELLRADVLVLAVPRPALAGLDLTGYRGIVVDATNAWEPTDGPAPESTTPRDSRLSTSGRFAAAHPDLRVVKTFNHVSYTGLTAEARPHDEPGRRALGVASDDPQARSAVAAIVDASGFDPVEMTLEQGRLLEPDGPVFGNRYEADDLRELVARARG